MPDPVGDRSATLSVVTYASASGTGAWAVVTGEIEVSTVEDFTAGLTAALEREPATVAVDLAGVTFLGSAGIGALITVRNAAAAKGASASP